MSDTIKGSIIGAIITGIISIIIFFLGNFSTQATLEKSTVETLSEYFSSVDKDMSYKEALQIIYKESESAKNNIIELQKQLSDYEDQVTELNSTDEINKIIENVAEYWSNKEYTQTLTVLKNSQSVSEDIETLYKQYSDEYCTILIKQADLLISEKKYDQAKEILNEYKSIVYNDDKIKDKLEDIDDNMPIKLSSLKNSASRYFDLNTEKTLEDTVGNKYPSGNSFIAYGEGESNYGYATFYLGKEYKSFTGTIAVSDESENREDTQLEGWIEIYSKNGDEYNQLWVSPILSRMTSPVTIPEIKLTDAEWLEIRYYNNGEYWSLAAGYHSLRIILADGTIYKI